MVNIRVIGRNLVLPSYDDLRFYFDYSPDGFLIIKNKNYCNQVVGRKVGHKGNNKGYYSVKFRGERYLLHRLIYKWHTGEEPEEVDHIDRDPSNNRIENLRPATRQTNSRNVIANSKNKTGIKRPIVQAANSNTSVRRVVCTIQRR